MDGKKKRKKNDLIEELGIGEAIDDVSEASSENKKVPFFHSLNSTNKK